MFPCRNGEKRLGLIFVLLGVLLVVSALTIEIHSNSISKWIRKTDDVQHDQCSKTEAFTGSRQGLIEMCMDDFRRNPLFGMGFQVAIYMEWHL